VTISFLYGALQYVDLPNNLYLNVGRTSITYPFRSTSWITSYGP